MKKTITSFSTRAAIILLATLLLTLTAQTVWADTGYNYIAANGTTRNTYTDDNVADANVTVITSQTSGLALGVEGNVTWYVVTGTVNLEGGMRPNGTVHLILADNSNLNIINNTSDWGIYIDYSSSLTIYSQSLGEDMGSMTVTPSSVYVGGSSSFTIKLNSNGLLFNLIFLTEYNSIMKLYSPQ